MCLVPFDAMAEKRLVGWVSDAACGAQHTKPGGEDCVRKCIRGGEHINPEWKAQKMVLVADDGKTTWIVENPSSLAGLEGKRVRVAVSIHAGSIRITSSQIVKDSTK